MDFRYVEKARGFFKSEIKFKEIDQDKLQRYVEKVTYTIKSCNPMQVAIGIPIYIACETAKKDGLNVVLAGQGADELFAGYHRYLSMTLKELKEELIKDLENMPERDLRRDKAIAKADSIELRLPYLDKDVVSIALAMPTNLKIREGIRKYILREIAKRKGLPEFIINREKKAIQYSTGVDKALRKIVKKKNKTLKGYLKEVYQEDNQKD